MKKRFFLLIIFLIFFASVLYRENKEKIYVESAVEEEMIFEKSSSPNREEALADTLQVFIIPIIFAFVVMIQIYANGEEFEIGTVERKLKYRKQMPRGNLA